MFLEKTKINIEPLFRVMSLEYVLYVSIDRSKPSISTGLSTYTVRLFYFR